MMEEEISPSSSKKLENSEEKKEAEIKSVLQKLIDNAVSTTFSLSNKESGAVSPEIGKAKGGFVSTISISKSKARGGIFSHAHPTTGMEMLQWTQQKDIEFFKYFQQGLSFHI